MKVLQFFTFSLALILTFTISLAAQSTSVADSKARLVNTQAFFDEKTGIKDFIEVYGKLKEEFKPQNQELMSLAEEYRKLQNEMSLILEKRPICRPDAELYNKKKNESESIMCKIEIQQNKTKLLYEKRESLLREEVNKKIVIALKQFAKENGYSAIVDISKEVFVWNGLSISINDSLDITKEFIQFYNEQFVGKKLQ